MKYEKYENWCKKMSNYCVICHRSGAGDVFVKLTEKGLKSLIQAAEQRGESDKSIHFNLKSQIHETCRKNYVSKEKIVRWNAKQENGTIKQVKRTRSSDLQHNLPHCLFCGCVVDNVDIIYILFSFFFIYYII